MHRHRLSKTTVVAKFTSLFFSFGLPFFSSLLPTTNHLPYPFLFLFIFPSSTRVLESNVNTERRPDAKQFLVHFELKPVPLVPVNLTYAVALPSHSFDCMEGDRRNRLFGVGAYGKMVLDDARS